MTRRPWQSVRIRGGGILVDDIPFERLSTAERLELAVRLAELAGGADDPGLRDALRRGRRGKEARCPGRASTA